MTKHGFPFFCYKKQMLNFAFIIFLFLVVGCSSKYDPMILEPIYLSDRGYHNEYVFTNNYPGRYDIGLYVDTPVYPLDSYDTKFQLEISIFLNNKPILTRQLSQSEFNFYGWEKGKGGMALLVYESPKDLPLNQSLICSVTVVDSDDGFESKYGKPMFYVRKMSDK